MIYSLIGTAKHGLDPAPTCTACVARIAEHPINRIADLPPVVSTQTLHLPLRSSS
jgi:hypothetical protein